MISIHEQYIVDEDGHRQAAVIPMTQWKQVLDALEELDDIRSYDEAKQHASEPVPFEQAVREIRAGEPV